MVQSKLSSSIAESQSVMSEVNKSKSDAISMLFVDVEVTTEEVNKKQFIMFGEEDREWISRFSLCLFVVMSF